MVVDPNGGVTRAAASLIDETPKRAGPSSATDDLRTAGEPSPEVDAAALRAAVDWAFAEPDPKLPRNTRAVLVVHDGRIIAERYAEGFGVDTALIGWSMTKSVVNALVGILVKEGKLSLDAPVPLQEWAGADDPRRAITLAQLLHMTSGLEFEENYANPLADVTYMLFGVPNAAEFAVAKPLRAQPGTRWQYSSGTSNILTHAIRARGRGSGLPRLPAPRRSSIASACRAR